MSPESLLHLSLGRLMVLRWMTLFWDSVLIPREPFCKKIGATGHEWLDNLSEEIHDGLAKTHQTNNPVLMERKLQELKSRFPDQGPYVLTHTDLSPANVMIKDGEIEAIIDWEWAGYYP
ncbi:hypothetical protein ONS95_015074 [Cadophora gregata]|uniref:uncharacterized protein n=1 Tax=Cadophora gregata TaxID=51156 RepID=UPI0026DD2724|nr:uncharacterized protein ONS95_015074 [Cadophora gregata]KAK0112734.1 hypothetical protein ONS95_015074 [Cadophora gregata]KAK0124869.1 hypothetical protein ONS96_014957 [Cadophora gregata f. sp. sojae]